MSTTSELDGQDYHEVLGTVSDRGKVHRAFDDDNSVCCNNGATKITTTLAVLNGFGFEAIIAALRAADVEPARLCANCFRYTRARYEQIRTAAPERAEPRRETKTRSTW
jgi:hypothetical protein